MLVFAQVGMKLSDKIVQAAYLVERLFIVVLCECVREVQFITSRKPVDHRLVYIAGFAFLCFLRIREVLRKDSFDGTVNEPDGYVYGSFQFTLVYQFNFAGNRWDDPGKI